MKKFLLAFMIGIGFTSGCEKEKFLGEHDLRGDNLIEKLSFISYKNEGKNYSAILSRTKSLDSFYFQTPDTLRIIPGNIINPVFFDYDLDENLDFTYSVSNLEKTSHYWVKNSNGTFSGEAKLIYESKKE